MTATHWNCIDRTFWEPSMMAAGSSSVRLTRLRSQEVLTLTVRVRAGCSARLSVVATRVTGVAMWSGLTDVAGKCGGAVDGGGNGGG